jgi:hypothetical protein
MIERQTIAGREATVAFLNNDFEPATKDEATLIKVVFDDGHHLWLVPRAEDRGKPAEAADVNTQIRRWFGRG